MSKGLSTNPHYASRRDSQAVLGWVVLMMLTTVVLASCEHDSSSTVPPEPTPSPTTKTEPTPPVEDENPVEQTDEPSAPARTECFVDAYPNAVEDVVERDGRTFLKLADGTEIVWDDGRDKSFDETLNNADMEDTVSIPYLVGEPEDDPDENEDPGRFRHDPFMKQLYGTSEGEVRDNLVSVPWPGGTTIAFNERHGAADALEAVSGDLEALPKELRKYFTKTAGTFNWRVIKGTKRMSAHSYAVALDINVEFSNYWRWQDKTGEDLTYQNRIPWEIVEVFERHGFIWGGKWHHYDTMHFEYRPELFQPTCSTQ